MTDREKVIKGLETIKQFFGYGLPSTAEMFDSYSGTLNDAITMLKEQEAVKPVPPEDEFGLYRCGKCYYQLFRCIDKYCSRCGQAVKWDDC